MSALIVCVENKGLSLARHGCQNCHLLSNKTKEKQIKCIQNKKQKGKKRRSFHY